MLKCSVSRIQCEKSTLKAESMFINCVLRTVTILGVLVSKLTVFSESREDVQRVDLYVPQRQVPERDAAVRPERWLWRRFWWAQLLHQRVSQQQTERLLAALRRPQDRLQGNRRRGPVCDLLWMGEKKKQQRRKQHNQRLIAMRLPARAKAIKEAWGRREKTYLETLISGAWLRNTCFWLLLTEKWESNLRTAWTLRELQCFRSSESRM